MNIIKFLKTTVIVIMIGSSIVFTSMALQAASNTIQIANQDGKTNPNTKSPILVLENKNIDFKEVQILLYILEALGVAIIILFVIMQRFSSLPLGEFYVSINRQINKFAII